MTDRAHLFARDGGDIAPRGLDIGLDEHGDVVEQGRQERRCDDFGVADGQPLGHQEGGGAHDWRHDLAARGRDGLEGTGGLGRVATLSH